MKPPNRPTSRPLTLPDGEGTTCHFTAYAGEGKTERCETPATVTLTNREVNVANAFWRRKGLASPFQVLGQYVCDTHCESVEVVLDFAQHQTGD